MISNASQSSISEKLGECNQLFTFNKRQKKETKQPCVWQSSVKPQSLPTQNLSPWNWLHFSHWGRELTSPLFTLTWFNRQNLVKLMAFQVYSQASSNLVLFCSFSLSVFPLPLWGRPWFGALCAVWRLQYIQTGAKQLQSSRGTRLLLGDNLCRQRQPSMLIACLW